MISSIGPGYTAQCNPVLNMAWGRLHHDRSVFHPYFASPRLLPLPPQALV